MDELPRKSACREQSPEEDLKGRTMKGKPVKEVEDTQVGNMCYVIWTQKTIQGGGSSPLC